MTGRRRRKRGSGWEYVHVAIDDASRVATISVHADETGRSACKALVSALQPWSQGPPPAHRQRRVLSLKALSATLQTFGVSAQTHTPVHASYERQGRTLHPDHLAGMGIRSELSKLVAAPQGTARVASSLQLAPAARRDQIHCTHTTLGLGHEQPAGFTQLVLRPRRFTHSEMPRCEAGRYFPADFVGRQVVDVETMVPRMPRLSEVGVKRRNDC